MPRRAERFGTEKCSQLIARDIVTGQSACLLAPIHRCERLRNRAANRRTTILPRHRSSSQAENPSPSLIHWSSGCLPHCLRGLYRPAEWTPRAARGVPWTARGPYHYAEGRPRRARGRYPFVRGPPPFAGPRPPPRAGPIPFGGGKPPNGGATTPPRPGNTPRRPGALPFSAGEAFGAGKAPFQGNDGPVASPWNRPIVQGEESSPVAPQLEAH